MMNCLLVPIGSTKDKGLDYPRNPRFNADGQWLPRRQWPSSLQWRLHSFFPTTMTITNDNDYDLLLFTGCPHTRIYTLSHRDADRSRCGILALRLEYMCIFLCSIYIIVYRHSGFDWQIVLCFKACPIPVYQYEHWDCIYHLDQVLCYGTQIEESFVTVELSALAKWY